MRYLVFLILLAIVVVWLVQRGQDEREAEKAKKKESLGDQIHEVTDYTTGRTQTNILIDQTVNLRKIQIQRAVSDFEAMNGRTPKGLDELVQENLIGEEDKYIRYGNVKYEIESGQTPDGRFFIRGAGRDRVKGTKDDWEFVL
jgi:hypothetical protein